MRFSGVSPSFRRVYTKHKLLIAKYLSGTLSELYTRKNRTGMTDKYSDIKEARFIQIKNQPAKLLAEYGRNFIDKIADLWNERADFWWD